MNLELHIGDTVVHKVANLEEASMIWQRHRDEQHLGVRDTPAVYVQDGNHKIARISYNGRCWEPGTDREIPLRTSRTIEAEVNGGW
jgi:hypothetical protein